MKKMFLFLLTAAMLQCCTVLNHPISADKKAVDKLFAIEADVNKLYNHYDFNQSEYANIETEVSDLVVIDIGRPNAGDIVKNVQILQKLVFEFEAEHKNAGTLKPGEALVYRQYLLDKIKDISNAENSLK